MNPEAAALGRGHIMKMHQFFSTRKIGRNDEIGCTKPVYLMTHGAGALVIGHGHNYKSYSEHS